jgi:hypothetical protein
MILRGRQGMSKAYRFTQTIRACVTNAIGRAPVASSSTPLALLTNSSVRSQPGDASSGIVEGGADGRVEAHSGFAYAFRPNTNGPYTAGFQIEGCHFSYVVGSRSIGGSATAEGAVLLVVVLEPPAGIVAAARAQLWHRRVSGTETARDSQNRPRLQLSTRSFGLTAGEPTLCLLLCTAPAIDSRAPAWPAPSPFGASYINSIAVFTTP